MKKICLLVGVLIFIGVANFASASTKHKLPILHADGEKKSFAVTQIREERYPYIWVAHDTSEITIETGAVYIHGDFYKNTENISCNSEVTGSGGIDDGIYVTKKYYYVYLIPGVKTNFNCVLSRNIDGPAKPYDKKWKRVAVMQSGLGGYMEKIWWPTTVEKGNHQFLNRESYWIAMADCEHVTVINSRLLPSLVKRLRVTARRYDDTGANVTFLAFADSSCASGGSIQGVHTFNKELGNTFEFYGRLINSGFYIKYLSTNRVTLSVNGYYIPIADSSD